MKEKKDNENNKQQKQKNHKIITYFVFITFIIIPLIPMCIFLKNLYCSKESEYFTIWSSWISVLASISFGALVSMVVQTINDIREKNTKKYIITSNRARLLERVNNILNSFVSNYHDCEAFLVAEYKFMKDSYSENKIDFSNIVQNLCFAEKLKVTIKKGKKSSELNNYLLNGKFMRNQYNDMIKNLKQVALEMQNLNQLNSFSIFTETEINDFLFLTEITGNTIFDAKQSKSYLKSIFRIVEEYKFKINVYINYEWALVSLTFLIANEEDNYKLF